MHPPNRVNLSDLGPPYDAVLDELLTRWGDDTRFVVHSTPDSVDLAYLRDDLIIDDLLPRIDELITRARERVDKITHLQTIYGELETTITIHADAIVLQFHGPDEEGLIATMDRTPGVLEQLVCDRRRRIT